MRRTIVFEKHRIEHEPATCWDPSATDDRHITTALLLAAGTGTRLQPLTDGSPKCLTEVCGVAILGRLVSCLVEQGFRRLVVVLGYRGEQIRDYLELHAPEIEVQFVECREYNNTNNIYSLWLAREHIQEPFVLIESDLVFDSHLLGLMRVDNRIAVVRHQPQMLGTTVLIDESGRVDSFCIGAVQHPHKSAYKTVNLYSFSVPAWREVARRLGQHITAGRVHNYYEVVFAELAAEGLLPMKAVSFDGQRWCEIDTHEDLRVAERMFSESRGGLWTTNRSYPAERS